MKNAFTRLERMADTDTIDGALEKIKKTLNSFGVYLVVHDSVANNKVCGTLVTYRKNPAVYLNFSFFKNPRMSRTVLLYEITHLAGRFDGKTPIVSWEKDVLESLPCTVEYHAETHETLEKNV